MRQQARDALDRWSLAVAAASTQGFVPIGGQTGQIGDWESSAGDNKGALMSGKVAAAVALPTTSPPPGQVKWADGSTRAVRTISAAEALRRLVAAGSGDCGGCVTLQVTAARLTTAQIQTSRGSATAPVWEFTLRGTAVRVTRLAVAVSDTITVTPPSWDAFNPPGGLAIDRATAAADGRRLTVEFTGAPHPGDRPCGADYTAEAVESSTAVVIIVVPRRHADGESCLAIGAPRTAVAELAAPLGDRAVLEVTQGQPVAVTFAGS